MITIKGNLLNQQGVILHQVNCKRVMGAGIAKQIRSLYPQHYTDYLSTPQQLGNIVITHISPSLTIIGLFAQYDYGRYKQYTDYNAFEQCLIKVAQLNEQHIFAPYKIGCGLAGGDWNIVQSLFEKHLPQTIFIML